MRARAWEAGEAGRGGAGRGEAGQGEAGQGEGGALAKYVLCRFSTALQNMKRQMYLQPQCGCAARRTTDGRDHFPPTHPPRQTTTSCIQHWARPMLCGGPPPQGPESSWLDCGRRSIRLHRSSPGADVAIARQSNASGRCAAVVCRFSLCVRGCVVRCDVCGALSKKLIRQERHERRVCIQTPASAWQGTMPAGMRRRWLALRCVEPQRRSPGADVAR